MSRAIIVGVNGQDGRILDERLRQDGCAVFGIARGGIDITDRAQVRALVAEWKPDRVFYLAAFHHAAQESAGADGAELFEKSHAVHVRGAVNFLEAIREASPATRLFYAASALVFGEPPTERQDERTPLNPRCLYGITKTAGMHCCRFYRETHGVFAAAGILYNHESRFRPEKFVSQKIARAAVAIAKRVEAAPPPLVGVEAAPPPLRADGKLILGDLSAQTDWGYAPDFVEAMVRSLALERAEDFVVATGEAHTVREFVEIAFARLGLDWREHVEENPALLHRRRPMMIGDASRLRTATGWRPSVTFREMVESLVDAGAEMRAERIGV